MYLNPVNKYAGLTGLIVSNVEEDRKGKDEKQKRNGNA